MRHEDLRLAALIPKPIKQAQLADAIAQTRNRRAVPNAADADAARVLVVDDNEANRIVAETVLRRSGYDVHLATNGREAIAAFRRVAPDLVLMDVQMPDMDGIAATAAIRALENATDRRPIFALTAATSGEDRARCAEAQMDGYIVKPLRREELLETVAHALAAAPRVRASTVPAAPTFDDDLDADFMAEIAGRFLEEAVVRCAALHAAVAGGEAKAVEHIGHYLKGGAAQLAIAGVRDIAAAIETLGRTGQVASAAGLLPSLEDEIAVARRAVAVRGEAADGTPP